METVGIRELKENISHYMKRVKTGERIIITDRKKEIAIIMPLENKATEEKINQLIRTGKARWSGSKPEGMTTRIVIKGESVSSAVIEDRR